MSKIVYDNAGTNRFPSGLNVKAVITSETELSCRPYEVHRMTCCSSVKSTMENWFYLVENTDDLPLIQKWIDEIKSMFPRFNIKLFEVPKKVFSEDGTFDKLLLSLQHAQKDGTIISMPLEYREQYTQTLSSRIRKDSKIRVERLSFLINEFLWWMISTKVLLLEIVDHRLLIDNFLKENFERIKDVHLSRPFANSAVTINIENEKSALSLRFTVSPMKIVADMSDDELKTKLANYLYELTERNKSAIDSYINKYSKQLSGTVWCIKAEYSKKTYTTEAYLAHHLIRAALSIPHFRDYINQYFLIKEALPDMYFWNIIFLTQFGFDYYYYYWLTDRRLFKLTTAKEFEKVAKNWADPNTRAFFENFAGNYHASLITRMKNHYIESNFKEVVELMSIGLSVRVKPECKSKFVNLQLSDIYAVSLIEDDYYFIKGDDLTMRKYKKSNFIELKAS